MAPGPDPFGVRLEPAQGGSGGQQGQGREQGHEEGRAAFPQGEAPGQEAEVRNPPRARERPVAIADLPGSDRFFAWLPGTVPPDFAPAAGCANMDDHAEGRDVVKKVLLILALLTLGAAAFAVMRNRRAEA